MDENKHRASKPDEKKCGEGASRCVKKFPTNSIELTENLLDEMGFSLFYLLDGNIIDCFESIHRAVGVDMLQEINTFKDRTYLFSNHVIIELLNRPQSLNISIAENHIINAQGGHSGDKENRFLVEEDGEVHVAYGTNVSPEDWAQILLCQNHQRLKLVSNDRDLVWNSLRSIGEHRTLTVMSLVQELISSSSERKNLRKVLDHLKKPGVTHVLIKQGTPISWLKTPAEGK